MKTFRCEVCLKTFPESLKHEHHKTPKSLGGSDRPENIALLCNADHMHLHAISYMMINPRRKAEVEPTVRAIYGQDTGAIRRCLALAQLVAKEMFLKKEIRKEPSSEVRTVVELPSRYMELLRLSGYDQPHTRTGRPTGVSTMIRRMIAEALLKRYPRNRDEILKLLPKTKAEPESGS